MSKYPPPKSKTGSIPNLDMTILLISKDKPRNTTETTRIKRKFLFITLEDLKIRLYELYKSKEQKTHNIGVKIKRISSLLSIAPITLE